MKTKTTRKYIYAKYGKHFTVCLGDRFSNLLNRFCTPLNYTCGIYGWNADVFYLNGFCIVCGYRPFGNNNVKLQNLFESVINSNDKSKFEEVIHEVKNILENNNK